MNKQQITGRQFFFIIFVSITCLTFFSVPNQLASQVKQDLWISMVLGTLIDVYVAFLLAKLGLQHPGQTLVQYSSSVLGKALGKLAGFCFLLFFLMVLITSMWVYCDFLSRSLLPETPQLALSITMTVCAGLATWFGIEAIARLSQLIGALILITSIILFISSIPYVHLPNLLPQLEDGWMPAIRGSIYPGSWFGICITMGMLMPHMTNPSRIFRLKSSAVVLGSFIMTLYLLYSLAVMGPDMAGRFENPIYVFSRITQIIIFERVEVLLLLIFISGSFITISVLYHSLAEGCTQFFGTKTARKWIIPLGLVILLSPAWPLGHESPFVTKYLGMWFPFIALSIEGGLTTLLYIVSIIRAARQ